MADTIRCEVGFTTGGRTYPVGQEFDVDDPIVKRYPSMFSTEVRTAATVPGEVTAPPPPVKKATKRAAKRASARKDD